LWWRWSRVELPLKQLPFFNSVRVCICLMLLCTWFEVVRIPLAETGVTIGRTFEVGFSLLEQNF
jgi:hypothetical protein